MKLNTNLRVYDDYEELDSSILKKKTRSDIILFAKLQYWDGYRYAVVNVSEKEKTKSIYDLVTKHLTSGDTHLTVYANEEDVITTEAHHDGTHKYWYRQITKKSYEKLNKILEKAYDGEGNISQLFEEFMSLTKPIFAR